MTRHRRWILAAGLVLAAAAVAGAPAGRFARAAGLLLRVVGADDPTGLTRLLAYDVEERGARVRSGARSLRARMYAARGLTRPPGAVLLHGVHAAGIDEPHLRTFARALAATGASVLTPELPELRDYRVEPSTLDDIEACVRRHAATTGRPVGVWGISFAGGLALIAAARPDAERIFDHVVAVGAHHDLVRLARYYAGEDVRGPDGSRPIVPPHPYGARVIVRAYPEYFENADDVRRHLMRAVRANESALARVSPRGRLQALRVPTFLVHGVADPVIPSLETLHLEREVPPSALRRALVTPVLRHTEAATTPTLAEHWAVVRLVAEVLEEATE